MGIRLEVPVTSAVIIAIEPWQWSSEEISFNSKLNIHIELHGATYRIGINKSAWKIESCRVWVNASQTTSHSLESSLSSNVYHEQTTIRASIRAAPEMSRGKSNIRFLEANIVREKDIKLEGSSHKPAWRSTLLYCYENHCTFAWSFKWQEINAERSIADWTTLA